MRKGRTVKIKCIRDFYCCDMLCFKSGSTYTAIETLGDEDGYLNGYNVEFDNEGKGNSLPIELFYGSNQSFEIVKTKENDFIGKLTECRTKITEDIDRLFSLIINEVTR